MDGPEKQAREILDWYSIYLRRLDSVVFDRSGEAEARELQQKQYQQDLLQFIARKKEKERERRERWLERHQLLENSFSRGYRLNGGGSSHLSSTFDSCGSGRRLGSKTHWSDSRLFKEKLNQAVVPYGLNIEEYDAALKLSESHSGNHDDDVISSPDERSQQSRLPSRLNPSNTSQSKISDLTSQRLLYQFRREAMEYDRKRRRVHEVSASNRHRIPSNDPGHRLGRPGEHCDIKAPRPAWRYSFRSFRSRRNNAASNNNSSCQPEHSAPNQSTDAQPTITLPEDYESQSHNTIQEPQYTPVSGGQSEQYAFLSDRFLRVTGMRERSHQPPRVNRSPTVARNTPTTSMTSTTAIGAPNKPLPRSRTTPKKSSRPLRTFSIPKTITPLHDCNKSHGCSVSFKPPRPTQARAPLKNHNKSIPQSANKFNRKAASSSVMAAFKANTAPARNKTSKFAATTAARPYLNKRIAAPATVTSAAQKRPMAPSQSKRISPKVKRLPPFR